MNSRRRLFLCLLLAAATVCWVGAGAAGSVHVDPVENTQEATAVQDSSGPGDARYSTDTEATQRSAALAQDIENADSVRMSADIRESGDARWEVSYRLRLEDEESRQAFSDLQSDIEANRSAYLGPFERRLTDTVETAADATGREMSAGEFAVSTRTESQPQAAFGVVTFSFEWRGFAAVDGDAIRAGDAIDRLFLGENQRLQLGWPDGYRLESSSPDPQISDDGRVVWRGPIDFDAGQPRIVAVPAESDSPLLLVIGAGGSVLVFAALAYWWFRLRSDGSTVAGGPSDEQPGETPSATEADDPPPELLSNEERLLRLVQENGGRMKQKAVAEELDWSAAKTSQVVSDLREDEEIESFRLGRENILTMPDVDVVEDGEE